MISVRQSGCCAASSTSPRPNRPNTSRRPCCCVGRMRSAKRDGKPGPRASALVRLFAQWLNGLNPAHEVPSRGLIPSRYRRMRPYIYSAAEIATIVEAAAELPSVYGMRGLTCSTLFGLIAATGLRISEALGLDSTDADLHHGALRIRRGKLGKERLIPLTESVTTRPRNYAGERDRLLGRTPGPV